MSFLDELASYDYRTVLRTIEGKSLRDVDRALSLLGDDSRPLHFILAGKAHPRDADEVLELVGLREKRDALTKTLSGGQRRRRREPPGRAGISLPHSSEHPALFDFQILRDQAGGQPVGFELDGDGALL